LRATGFEEVDGDDGDEEARPWVAVRRDLEALDARSGVIA